MPIKKETWTVGRPCCTSTLGNFCASRSTISRSLQTQEKSILPKKSGTRLFPRRLPPSNDLIDHRGLEAHCNPDKDLLDGEVIPSRDQDSDHLRRLEAPPPIGDAQGSLPEQACQQHHKECERKGAPINDRQRGRKEHGRWAQSSYHEESEVPRKSRLVRRDEMTDENCQQDQRYCQQQRLRMKTQQAIKVHAFGC